MQGGNRDSFHVVCDDLSLEFPQRRMSFIVLNNLYASLKDIVQWSASYHEMKEGSTSCL